MFESRTQPPASRRTFLLRLAGSAALALMLVAVSLFAGILGYHYLAGLGWVDALLNASMILSGMGPVSELTNDTAKIFASFYALGSGIVLIGVMGLLLAPLAHRGLHLFHLDERDIEGDANPKDT